MSDPDFIFRMFVLIAGPFVVIWAINELLEQASVATQIPFNFWTWFSLVVVIVLTK